LNNTPINGKKIKVELQDNSRRRKGPDEARSSTRNDGCFVCGKPGHIAKNCREKQGRNYLIKNAKNEEGEAHLLRNAPKRNTKNEAGAVPAVPAGPARTKKTEAARSRNRSTKKREDTVLQVRPDSDEWPY
jgi:hypothetical protein